ncbi:lipopolysaccharide biosynthesis protein [Natronorubrum texcoconense]|uniref:Membrane protein involved in the export of O-antigen and teichoic acid n=1 Tax=Natronorubrum texcoconense TaxID=1095776 RepID=A0A1G8VRK9_9EURY|nr:polysaccharide biosynthesis C-terminal domain-containing protein [Natronorubrum texcoconense]SDJ68025.1 Membrane protein involved in the export of O-antigen and teichoic acid [Natronorubrum texcoconense]
MSSRTVSGIISVLSGKIGVLLLGVVITPILVRILGSGKYGDYALILSIFSILTTIVHAGISAGIRKFMAEQRSESGWQGLVFAFYGRFAFGLASVVGTAVVLFGFFGPVEAIFGDGFSIYLVLLAVMLVTDQVFYVMRYTLMGLNFEQLSEPLLVLKKVLFGIFGLSLAYIGFDVAGVLAGTAIASIVCGIVAVWLLRKHVDFRSLLTPVPSDFPRRDLLGFNLYNTIFILLTISLYNVDILLLQPIAGSHETGLYKSALVVSEFMWIVPQAVQIIFIHSASEQWSKENHEAITEMASRATRFTLAFTLLLAIGIAALATEFVELYFGAEFVGAVTPLLLLLPGVVGFAIARPIFAIGQGKGDLRVLIAATGSAALINLVLNVLLIPRYGMAGAAVATTVGYGSMLVFHLSAARRIGFNPLVDLRLREIGTAGAVTAIAVFGTASFIESSFLSLVLVPPIGFTIYAIVSLKIGVFSPSEVRILEQQLPNRTARFLRLVSDKVQ